MMNKTHATQNQGYGQKPERSVQQIAVRMAFTLVCFLFSVLLTFKVSAQVFPIQVTSQLMPPYTPYFSDYTSPGAQRLMIQLRANDVNLSEYDVRLRITIEGLGITIK